MPLLTLENLDRLNAHNDPQPDGVFDYIEGFTMLSSQARIIFPFLEPFGRDLRQSRINGSLAGASSRSMSFIQLYDTIKEIAKTMPTSTDTSSAAAKGAIHLGNSLGAFNVPQGSVIVSRADRY